MSANIFSVHVSLRYLVWIDSYMTELLSTSALSRECHVAQLPRVDCKGWISPKLQADFKLIERCYGSCREVNTLMFVDGEVTIRLKPSKDYRIHCNTWILWFFHNAAKCSFVQGFHFQLLADDLWIALAFELLTNCRSVLPYCWYVWSLNSSWQVTCHCGRTLVVVFAALGDFTFWISFHWDHHWVQNIDWDQR